MRWLWLFLLIPALASAGENCSMLGGTCKEVCAAHEEVAKGAFLDCTDRQDCCVEKETSNSRKLTTGSEGKDAGLKPKTKE